jgi:hypothetical protein
MTHRQVDNYLRICDEIRVVAEFFAGVPSDHSKWNSRDFRLFNREYEKQFQMRQMRVGVWQFVG